MSKEETRKNPKITELELKEDIILVRSSQEQFGRPSKVLKKKITTPGRPKRDHEFSRSAHTLPHCSLESGVGRELSALIDQAVPNESFKSKFGSDLAEPHHVKKALKDKMDELDRRKHEIEASYSFLPALHIVLRMPNVVKTLHLMSTLIRKERINRALKTWKTYVLMYNAYLEFESGKKRHAAAVLQRFWRASKARRDLYERRKKKQQQLRRKSSIAVSRIESNYKRYRKEKEKKESAAGRLLVRRQEASVLIQRVFRGWVGRSWRVDCLRVLLLKDMRSWADGNIQKLLERSTLQDAKTAHKLLKCIGMTSIPPRPMRSLPTISAVRGCRKWVAMRRDQEETKAAALREEYRNMLRERKDMALNDLQDEFRRHFKQVLLDIELQKQKVQEEVDKREEEAARIRKIRASTNNIVESVKVENVLERTAREEMFRCEYQQRAVEDRVQAMKQHRQQTEWIVMDVEDSVAQKIALAEEEEASRQEKMYEELQKVRNARQQELMFDAKAIVKGGKIDRSVVVKRPEAVGDGSGVDDVITGISTDDFAEVSRMVQRGFDGSRGCGRSEVCSCDVDWKTSPKGMQHCMLCMQEALRKGVEYIKTPFIADGSLSMTERPSGTPALSDSEMKSQSSLNCQVEACISPDKDCLGKYIVLVKLRGARHSREQFARQIWLLQAKLKAEHASLMEIRDRLKKGKFAVRSDRKFVQEEAVMAEQAAVKTGEALVNACRAIYEQAHREIKFFFAIFHTGFVLPKIDGEESNRDEPQVPSPLSMNLSDNDEAAIKSIVREHSDYYDIGASEFISDSKSLLDSVNALPEWPAYYKEALVAEGKLAIPKKVVKAEYSSHFKSHLEMRRQSNYHNIKDKYLSSSSKQNSIEEETNKKLHVESLVKDRVKTVRDIPGLCKFPMQDITKSQVYIEAEITKKWCGDLSKWFYAMEDNWKEQKRNLCVSYLQRARHLLYGGNRYNSLKHNDSRLAQTIDKESSFDLMEFLLCRGGFTMKPSNAFESYVVEETHMSSEVVDAVLGKHPFSIAVYLYLVSQAKQMEENNSEETCSEYSIDSLSKNNIFALTRLLKLPHKLQHDSLALKKYANATIEWKEYLNPRWQLSNDQYQFLKLHHLYSMEVCSALVMAISMEIQDCRNLMSTLTLGSLLTLVEIVPEVSKPTKGKMGTKSTKGDSRQQLHGRKASGGLQARGRPRTRNQSKPKVEESSLLKSPSATGEEKPLKPIARIELTKIVHLGVLLQVHRNNMNRMGKSAGAPPFWVSVPSWMLPAYYWGRRAKPNFMKRMSTVGDTADPELEAFEVKITDWATSVAGLLAKRANKRLYREQREMNEKLATIHRENMEFEDALSHAVEKFKENKDREQQEAKDWAFQNSTWYKRVYNWAFGKKRVTFYPDGFSPEDMAKLAKKIKTLKSIISSNMTPPGMEVIFREPIVLSYVEVLDDQTSQMSLKDRHARHQARQAFLKPKAERGHISWLNANYSDGGGDDGPSRKAVIPKKFTQWLGEMFVGGGVRSVICIARTIMDFENNPQGSSIVEPMALYLIDDDVETVKYVRSCRVGFQDRKLCEASAARYAVSISEKGRSLSEFGFRMMRTEMPQTEMDSVDLKHQIVWRIFTRHRYNNAIVHDVLCRVQSMVRMMRAKKAVIKMREKQLNARKMNTSLDENDEVKGE